MATPIITDGSTDRVQNAPRVVLPRQSDLFGERARRFEALATAHSMAEYLRLMAAICHAQQAVYAASQAAPISAAAIAASRDYGMPPLSAQSHERSAQWRTGLAEVLRKVQVAASGGVRASLESFAAMDTLAIEALADRVLAGSTLDEDAAYVPFVGAALQVYFTRIAASLDAGALQQCDVPGICPVCASRPVASVVRLGGEQANLRYLVCSLCSTEWNLARIQCSSCITDKGVRYLVATQGDRQATDAATRAEACDECKSYLKIFYQDKDPAIEPHADDLATLALDVLVDEQGFARSGPNLLFHAGSG